EAAALRDGDARRLLSPVLERVQSEMREPSDVAARRPHAEDPAHLAPRSLQLRDLQPEQAVAADHSELPERDAAEPVDVVRGTGDRGLAAALAEPIERAVGQI